MEQEKAYHPRTHLVAAVDVDGADPELRGAAPRAEPVGEAVPQLLHLRQRQRHCGRRRWEWMYSLDAPLP